MQPSSPSPSLSARTRGSSLDGGGTGGAGDPTTPFPVRVTFRNIDRSTALEAELRHRAERLAPLGPEIIACGIVVEALRRGRRHSRLFRVRVELAIPGEDIVARSDVHDEDMARNPYAAAREAFDAVERRLLDRAGRLRSRRLKANRRSSEVPEASPVLSEADR